MLGCLFLACILLFLIVNICVKDKEVSEEENRSLTQEPKSTAESVLNGSYIKQFGSRSVCRKKFVAKNERVSEAVWWKSSGKWSFPWEKGTADGGTCRAGCEAFEGKY